MSWHGPPAAREFLRSYRYRTTISLSTHQRGQVVQKIVSHYKIIKKLGGGGMGEVYKAKDTRLGRYVALKFLPEKFTQDRLALERFEREARAASALDHPNICVIYDIGEHESQPYIVMQYLEGETLRQIIGKKPLETDRIIDFAKQLATGLEKAHSQGIIHRDIKPANVIITEDGLAKIVDFGLAKLSAERKAVEKQMTSPGSTVGTAFYMSPEQVRGEVLTAGSDLFSLGVILYEAATGRLPYLGTSSGAVYEEILHKKPISPIRINPEIPDELDHIINKCLEKDKELRYQSAGELLADLKRLSRDTDRFPIPAAFSRTPRDWTKVTSIALGVIGAAIVLVSILLSTGLFESATANASVGVVPFVNVSGERDQEALADGLTEDIVVQLSKISGLSVYRFKWIDDPPEEKAAELGVATILEGKIRRVGDKIRVSTQLVEAGSDRVLWSENYDQELTDVFALQTEISLKVAEALEVELLPGERKNVEKSPTDSIEAYDLYLQGRYLRHHQENPVGLHQAVKYFQQAIEKDNKYALAYAGLSECYFMLAYKYAWQSWEECGKAAQLAVQYGEALPESHVAMGLWLDFSEDDGEGADAAFRRALELDPRHANARREYARFLMRRGRFDEALNENDKVQTTFAFTVHLTRAEIYRYRGQYDDAVLETQRFREIWTGSDEPLLQIALCYNALVEYDKAESSAQKMSEDHPARYRVLALTYMLQGRMQEAREASWHLIRIQPDTRFSWWLVGYLALLANDLPQAQASFERAYQLKTRDDLNWWRPYATYLGITHWRMGDRERAEELFAERIQLNEEAIRKGNQNPELCKDMAVIYATRGEPEEAVRWMEKAFENGYALYDLTLKDGLLEDLRDHPRFQQIIAAMETRVAAMRSRVEVMEAEWNQ